MAVEDCSFALTINSKFLCVIRGAIWQRTKLWCPKVRMRFGQGWAKSHRFYTGQTPVLKCFRQLREAILHDRVPIAKIVNATVILLSKAPEGYQDFDQGAPKKFVLDPQGILGEAA